MKAGLSWILIVVALALLIGCGGGGGGSTTGTTDATTDATTDGTTSGNVNTGLRGQVLYSNGAAAIGAKVDFYRADGVYLDTATTDNNGNFTKQLPVSAKKMTVRPRYYDHDDDPSTPQISGCLGSYNYNSNNYAEQPGPPASVTCLASIPKVEAGKVKNLATPVVYLLVMHGPPPPPSGCLFDN